MRCNIHGDHMTITPALKEYVENKVGRLDKFDLLSDADDCRVTLRVTKKTYGGSDHPGRKHHVSGGGIFGRYVCFRGLGHR
ncbi:MAG TPA: HPF/RaiA family ribosome-associated protein [Candidatus Bathyarchaeia archaeon]|nr:HPF/RaiA family ribosome-associated protein [Candidatus Bathyarchaeia archaeon]